MTFSADREYARLAGPAFHEYNMFFCFFFIHTSSKWDISD